MLMVKLSAKPPRPSLWVLCIHIGGNRGGHVHVPQQTSAPMHSENTCLLQGL
ncbi:hypothetical protein HispidOSU_030206 [Sigmodon hispidus]